MGECGRWRVRLSVCGRAVVGLVGLFFRIVEIAAHVGLQSQEERTFHIAHVFLEHGLDVHQAVLVTSHLVAPLGLVGGGADNLVFALLPQPVAHLVEDRHDDGVEEVVTLDEEVSGLWGDSQGRQLLLEAQPRLLGFGVAVLEEAHLALHLVAQPLDGEPRVGQREARRIGQATEVGEREFRVVARAVHPDRPDKERVARLGEGPHISLKVEDGVVVERHHDAYIVEAGGITLEVLDGVYVGVKHVRTVDNLARGLRDSLQKVVVVCVHTGYHVGAHAVADKVHQHRLFAPLQSVM